jgi:exopolysaccharide biosynthesis polyprenyl glycosylphosphotransferase
VDARALVDDSLPVPRRHLRRDLFGLPGLLIGIDVAALAAAGLLARPDLRPAVMFGFLLITARTIGGSYRPRITVSTLDDLPQAVGSALAALGLTLAAEALIGRVSAHAHEVLLDAVFLFAISWTAGLVTAAAVRHRRRRLGASDRTLIVGTGSTARLLGVALLDNPQLGLLPTGYVAETDNVVIDLRDGAKLSGTGANLPLPILATRMQDLTTVLASHDISTVILAFESMPESQAVDTIIAAHQLGAAVLVVPPVLDLHHDSRDVERVRGVPMVRMRPDPTMRFSWWAKRAVDTAVSALALLLLSPGLLLVALLVLLDSGRPILFWQQRVGLDGRPFDLCKFRSMRPVSVTESQTTWTVTDSTRISRIGRFLRASSLDEVPQLWNVLRGDMSLVGPRPERPSFVDRFSDEHERYWARHRVPVGLTGLAQVNGLRGDTSIADRARYDNYYIANWSPWLDVKIVLLTFREVLRGSGG